MKRFKLEHPALEYTDENGGTGFIMVPGKMEVCPRCGGMGVHDRDDLDCSRLVDSMREDGDEEGLEAYFRGAYDQVCSTCNGRNVVFAADWSEVPAWAIIAIEDWNRCEREDARYAAMERRMGA